MAFTVEDGTGLANANSYVAVADADAYFSDRGVTSWAALTDTVKQAALIGGSDYIDMMCLRGRVVGIPLSTVQALQFPRVGMYVAPDGVPQQIKVATFEYARAWQANGGTLTPAPAYDATGRLYTKVVKTIGPISTEYDYAASGPSAAALLFRPYPLPDTLLRQFIRPYGSVAIRN